MEVRYYLGSAHYRSKIDYSDEALHDAAAAYQRIEAFVVRAVELAGRVEPGTPPQAFADAMDDDLGVPQALAVIHEAVREGNTALTAGDKDTVVRVLGELRAMLDVLGLDPLCAAVGGRRRRPHRDGRRARLGRARTATGRAGPQGLRRRRRDPRPSHRRRHPDRGHPARHSMGTQAFLTRLVDVSPGT